MNRKEEQWRNEGAAYALRTAKAKGIDGLKRTYGAEVSVEYPL